MGELEKGTKLSRIESHFKWEPVDGDIDAEPHKGIPHMMVNLKSYPSISGALVLIGYLHTKLQPPDYNEALKKFDHVLEEDPPPLESLEENRGYKMVALGDKIHTLIRMGQTKEAKELINKVENFEDLPDKARAGILSQHAFSLTFFGPIKLKKSIELYNEALQLSPDSYAVLDGFAFAYGRLRRYENKLPSKPSPEEIQSCCRAIKLSNWKISAPIVLLADLFFERGRTHPRLGIKGDKNYLQESKKLFQKSYELDPHSSNVLMRCGKAFQYFGDQKLAIKCLKEAVELDHHSSRSLFNLGKCLAREDDQENLKLAEECLFEAVTVGRRRHLFAEIELGKVRKQLNHKFDLKRHLENIKIYYVDFDDQLEIIEEEIKKITDFEKNRKTKNPNAIRNRSGPVLGKTGARTGGSCTSSKYSQKQNEGYFPKNEHSTSLAQGAAKTGPKPRDIHKVFPKN